MTRTEIETKINAFLINTLEIDAAVVKPESNLKADIGLTSLDLQEMKIFIKRNFGVLPDRQDVLRMNTLGDVYRYIELHQA